MQAKVEKLAIFSLRFLREASIHGKRELFTWTHEQRLTLNFKSLNIYIKFLLMSLLEEPDSDEILATLIVECVFLSRRKQKLFRLKQTIR